MRIVKVNFIFKSISFFILILVLVLPNFLVLAQTPSEERQVLEQELKQLEEQITQYEKDITKTQQEKNTLQNQINILKSKISKLDLQIKENNLMVQDLGWQIKDTEASIDHTTKKIEDAKEKLGKVLQLVYEEDEKSVVEILLSESKISNFFDNLVALNSLNIKIQLSLSDIKDLKTNLENQKTALDEEKEDLERLLKIQALQKQDLSSTKTSQEKLLTETKGKETTYQKLLQESQKRAAEIRSRIFELIGVPKAPTFGEAYEIAKFVSGITGVRPAFLLAIFTQESNIGKNVGQCYLTNLNTGEGVRSATNKKETRVMNPTRDIPLFLKIVGELGRDPYNTPVSCPLQTGWGGAMGPGQFIASTWMLYKDKVKAITGKPADPWDIRDAFLAAALYLKDSGALSNEWRAAMRYFSGSTWSKYEQYYGNSVIALARQYEEDIKAIE